MASIPPSLIPELVILNGKIITVDGNFTIAEAVAVNDGKIVALGSSADIRKLIGTKTDVIDLKGETMLPGINDSHTHLPLFGLWRPPFVLDVRPSKVGSMREIKRLVEEKARSLTPGDWIEGYGWNEGYLEECSNSSTNNVNRDYLDTVSRDNPVCLMRFDGHNAWVNSKALELANITSSTPDPAGGKIFRNPDTGSPTGLLNEEAVGLVRSLIPSPSDDTIKKSIISAMADLNAQGITSITDATVDPRNLSLYNDVYNEGSFTARMNLLLNWTGIGGETSLESLMEALRWTGTHTGFGNEWLKIGGVKIFADGMPSRKTSWEYEEFVGGGFGGLIVYGESDEDRYNELFKMIVYAHNRGFQAAVHATGARTIDTCVDGFVDAMRDNPWDARHYVIHGNLVSAKTAERMAEYNIGVNVQMALKKNVSHLIEEAMGKERSAYTFPLRTLIDAGVHVCNSSDAPMTYPDWRESLQTAVLRMTRATGEISGPQQCITLEEAICMHTIEGAWMEHMDKIKGSIEVGKLADFCVIGGDILGTDPSKVNEIPVLMTIVGGRIVFDAEPGYFRFH